MFYIEKCKVFSKYPFTKEKRYKEHSHNNSIAIVEDPYDPELPSLNIVNSKVPTLNLDKI